MCAANDGKIEGKNLQNFEVRIVLLFKENSGLLGKVQ